MILIIMGVSGAGKTTIGKALAAELSLPFFDGDDFHPQANVEKMAAGTPLSDDDRLPWLETLSLHIKEWQNETGAVVACSALKEAYREVLMSKTEGIRWIHLYGDQSVISTRMKNRPGHFMHEKMLLSQCNSLETPEYGLRVDIAERPEVILKLIQQWLGNAQH